MIHTVAITFNKKRIQNDTISHTQINGGMFSVDGVLTEAYDFLPNYSSLNSVLFESSVILTSWKHKEQLFNADFCGFIHDDIEPTEYFSDAVDIIENGPKVNASYGITTPAGIDVGCVDFTDDDYFKSDNDPWRSMSFDFENNIWDLIKRYDADSYRIATKNIPMIYGHQFICTNDVFDKVCSDLNDVLGRITLSEVGLWIPHIFERILAIKLYKYGTDNFKLLNMYSHNLSSGKGGNKLYGVKEYKFISC